MGVRLEKELEKPDWKQWLPVWGIYVADKAIRDGKLSLANFEFYDLRFHFFVAYHAICAGVPPCLRN
ncbi:MAG: hypothetical protein AABW51_03840 [Nanoarchaeota archaeon]